MDLLMRDDAPLTEQEWQAIDEAVLRTAKANLVGRRFLKLYGPLGLGVQAVWVDQYRGVTPGLLTTYGEEGEEVEIEPENRTLVPLMMLYKDFRVFWRDIATARELGTPLDTSAASAAAAMLARAEDQLILRGAPDVPGIMTVSGHASVAKEGMWEEPGSGLATVARAREVLVGNAAMGPYALVLSPDLYARLLRVMGQGGRLEIEILQSVADAGVFQTPVLGQGEGVLISTSPDVADLAIAQDMRVAYKGAENLNHSMRIFESLAPRIRRPQGICVLE